MTTATPTTVQSSLRVELILNTMSAVLSERARAVFANQQLEPAPNLYYFGCLYAETADQEVRLANHHDFARRVNFAIDQFDGRARMYTLGNGDRLAANELRRPIIYGCIAPPLEIPLVGNRVCLVAWLFIEDAPTGQTGKDWVNSIVGEKIRCALQGELPENPFDLPTLPEPPPADIKALIKNAQSA